MSASVSSAAKSNCRVPPDDAKGLLVGCLTRGLSLPVLFLLTQLARLHRLVLVHSSLRQGEAVQVIMVAVLTLGQRLECSLDDLLLGRLRVSLAHGGGKRLRFHAADGDAT